MIATLAGVAVGLALIVALAAVGERGGLPLHCSAEAAAAERRRPPWDPRPAAPCGRQGWCE